MKKVTQSTLFIAAVALLFCGCSTDDNTYTRANTKPKVGSIAFGGVLNQLTGDSEIKLNQVDIDASIPQCNDNNIPKYVRIALRDKAAENDRQEFVWVDDKDTDDDFFIDIPIVPISRDSDDNGLTNYLTMESGALELPTGPYSLEYFAVLNSDDEIIMMVPRKDEAYGPAKFQNFVKVALPITIRIQGGTKQYVDLETLCYDEVFARAYGYLYFDFEKVNLTYLCVFGNVCDQQGTHSPAHFRLKVWEYDNTSQEKGRLLVEHKNNVDFTAADPQEHSAEALCVPLPDRKGTDYYYGEIYLINANEDEVKIRSGVFTDMELSALYHPTDDNYEPYHFREGCCGLDDEPVLMKPTDDAIDCNVNPE